MDRAVDRPRGLTRRRWVLIGAGLLALATLAALVPAMRRWASAERAVDGSRIRLGTVARGDLERDVAADGRIVAALHPTLFSTSGGIVMLEVKAGTAVAAGQVLARVDSPELASRLQQERATLLTLESELGRQQAAARQSAARAQQDIDVLEVRLAAAERVLERARSTAAEGLISRIDLENAEDAVAITGIELKNARQTAVVEREAAEFEISSRRRQVERQQSIVAEVERQAARLIVRAPFDGVVASVAVEDRDAVPPNAPLLTVVNLSQFEVEFEIPENYGSEVASGTPAEISYEGRLYPGHVTAVSPEVANSQVRGTVVFDGTPPPGLRQSQRVRARLILERRAGAIKVARGPFLESDGGRFAYVVSDGMAVRRPITVGATSVSEVEILDGVNPGEQIVVSDTSLFQGARTVLIRD